MFHRPFLYSLVPLTDLQVQTMLRLELRAFTRVADEIELIGAARTDAGVHALNLPAHFDLPLGDMVLARRILASGADELLQRWNRRLPPVMANAACYTQRTRIVLDLRDDGRESTALPSWA